jgi:hypothetical protein
LNCFLQDDESAGMVDGRWEHSGNPHLTEKGGQVDTGVIDRAVDAENAERSLIGAGAVLHRDETVRRIAA